MLMRDLISKIDSLLTEATINPGERKPISFKLNSIEKLNKKIRDAEENLAQMNLMTGLPKEIKDDLVRLMDKLEAAKEKIEKSKEELEIRAQTESGRPIKLDNFFKALRKHCGQICKVYQQTDDFLYRGIDARDDAIYGKPRENRRSKDSNTIVANLLNDMMIDAGFEARRNNSLFTTGNYSQAKAYGRDCYIIFPVDGFSFTWSKTRDDVILGTSDLLKAYDQSVLSKLRDLIKLTWKDSDPENPWQWASSYVLQDSSVPADLKKLQEVVDDGKLPPETADLIKAAYTPEGLLDAFEFSDDDIYSALASNHEIYVTGAYYAVNAKYKSDVQEFIKSENLEDVELPEKFGSLAEHGIEPGDAVVIRNTGKIGLVLSIKGNRIKYKLHPEHFDEESISYQKVDKVQEDQVKKFNEGDYVTVNNLSYTKDSGKTGIVIGFEDNAYFIEFPGDRIEQYYWFNLELAEQPIAKDENGEQLKIGDVVAYGFSESAEILGILGDDTILVKNKSTGTNKELYSQAVTKVKDKESNTSSVSDSGPIKEGDRVKVVGGSLYLDMTGVVRSVDTSPGQFANVKIDPEFKTNNSGKTWTTYPYIRLRLNKLKKISTDTSASSDTEFKPGDIAEYVGTDYPSVKNPVTIKDTWDIIANIKRIQDSNDKQWYVPNKDLKKISGTAASDDGFKQDALVNYVGTDYPSVKNPVKIVSLKEPTPGYLTVVDKDGTYWDLEKKDLESPSQENSSEFKVGDKIEVVGKHKPATILDVDNKDKTLYIIYSDGITTNIHFDKASPLEVVPEHNFKIGDKVKNKLNGKTGTITHIYSDGSISIEPSSGNYLYGMTMDKTEYDNYEIINDKFEVGTKVKNSIGYVGTIAKVHDNGKVDIDFGYGDTAKNYLTSQLTIIPEIDLKVGDKVKNMTTGQIGKIDYISNDNAEADIMVGDKTVTWKIAKLEKIETNPPDQEQKYQVGDVVMLDNIWAGEILNYDKLTGKYSVKLASTGDIHDYIESRLHPSKHSKKSVDSTEGFKIGDKVTHNGINAVITNVSANYPELVEIKYDGGQVVSANISVLKKVTEPVSYKKGDKVSWKSGKHSGTGTVLWAKEVDGVKYVTLTDDEKNVDMAFPENFVEPFNQVNLGSDEGYF